MNAQEIFDTVVRHLFTQGHPALYDHHGEMCAYRAPNGDRCAFGALIPDAVYSPMMEGSLADTVIDHYGLDDFRPHAPLIKALQFVHDEKNLWTEDRRFHRKALADELIAVAKHHHLSPAVVDYMMGSADAKT